MENQLWRSSSSDLFSSSSNYSLDLLGLVSAEDSEETKTDADSEQLTSQQQQQSAQPQQHSSPSLVMELPALKPLQQQIGAIDAEIKTYFPSCRYGIAERCFLVARLFGDESAALFWLVALHYLRRKATRQQNQLQKCDKTDSQWSLPLSLDILMGNESYKDYQLKRLRLQDARASTYEQISQCTENSIYLGR